MEREIEIKIKIKERMATCDMCSQANQECFNSVNTTQDSNGGRDICKQCVEKLYNLLPPDSK